MLLLKHSLVGMAEFQKIIRMGGSFRITLPKQFCDLLGWCDGHKIKIKVVDGNNLLIINTSLGGDDDEKKDFFR